jgi:hypothetical protein
MKHKQEREALHQGELTTTPRMPRSRASRAYAYMTMEKRYQALLNWIGGHARRNREQDQKQITTKRNQQQ